MVQFSPIIIISIIIIIIIIIINMFLLDFIHCMVKILHSATQCLLSYEKWVLLVCHSTTLSVAEVV